MGILDNIKLDMLRLIELSGQISKYSEMLLHHSDMNDKRNFNLDKCTKIRSKIYTLQHEFYEIKNKYF